MPATTFRNENFNEITMSVCVAGDEVVVDCKSPKSRVLHRWTRREAKELRDLLREVLA